MHGIAINVNCDLSPYERIVPCGIDLDGHFVTSMKEQLHHNSIPADLKMNEIASKWIDKFGSVFGLHVEEDMKGFEVLDQIMKRTPHVEKLQLKRIMNSS